MKRFLIISCFLTYAQAQDARQVGVSVEIISTEAQTAFALAAKDHETSARLALEPLLANGSAKVEELAYAFTRSGAQTTVASIVEVIYPTEYDPPETAQKLHGPIDEGDQVRTAATPTAFQTRNVGMTFEVTPKGTDDGRVIEVDLVIDQVEHAGNDVQGQHESQLAWPRFHSKTIRCTRLLNSGEDTLVGLLVPKEATSPRRLLAFVRATYLPLNTKPALDPVDQATNIGILVEAIDVPEEALPDLLRQHVNADATLLREAVGSLIEEERASIKEMAFGINSSGKRGRVRSGNERIYGVEFDPPELPGTVQGPISADARLATPAHTTTMEMRPEGFWFEGSGQWNADNHTIDLTLSPEKTTHIGLSPYGQGLSRVNLPLFASQRLSTKVTVPDGGYALLGLHSERAKDGANLHHYTLLFARAHTRIP